MASPPSSAFGQISWVFGGLGLDYGAVTTLGVHHPSDVDAMFEAAEAWWTTTLKTIYNSSTRLEKIIYKRGPSASGPTIEFPVNENGSSTADPGPANVAILVRKQIEGLSNKFGGRMYLPSPSDGAVVLGDSLTENDLNAVQGVMDDLRMDLIGVDADPCVFHTNSSDPTDVSDFQVQPRIATQRRRLRR